MIRFSMSMCAMFGLAAVLANQTTGAVIVSTDFTGRMVGGNTASNITWTLIGVSNPGDLTAVDEDSTGLLAGLFDTGNAQGHFAPDLNIGNEGAWSTTIPLAITAASVTLERVVIDFQDFNNSGAFQAGTNAAKAYTVSVTGSSSGLLDSVISTTAAATTGVQNVPLTAPLTLTPAETYDLKIIVDGVTGAGNNSAFDAISIEGQFTPQGVLLSTDFNGRTRTTTNVANDTASNLTWSTSGVADPGALVAIDENATGNLAGLFDTSSGQNAFAPDMNIQNEGPWSVLVPIALTAPSALLEDVSFDMFQLNNSGTTQISPSDVDFTVSLIGSSSGLIATSSILDTTSLTANLVFSFGSPLMLWANQTYDLKIVAVGQGPGNNVGIDNLVVRGSALSIIPEPATLLIWSLLAGLGVGLRWRRGK